MTGIYIHIPFCRQKCHYCNFYSVASRKYRSEFVKAMLAEISLRRDYLAADTVDSIYIGGGTPSLFGKDELEMVFNALHASFRIAEDAEITLEANPDDLDQNYLDELRKTPVNRLSIGIQSFRDVDLAYLNRVHTAGQAGDAVRLTLDSGFENLSIDLIYGIPTLDDEGLAYNLDAFFSFDLPHLSAYALTVEPRTALDVLIRKGKLENINDSRQAVQFSLLSSRLQERGYIHYEISNFSRAGMYARHNTSYWLGGRYLGLGPSAHSFDGASRQWNVSNLNRYIQGMEAGVPFFEKEVLTTPMKYNEYIMVSLRTVWGADPGAIEEQFGEAFLAYFTGGIKKFEKSGQIARLAGSYVLTEKGKLHADGIAAELFWPE